MTLGGHFKQAVGDPTALVTGGGLLALVTRVFVGPILSLHLNNKKRDQDLSKSVIEMRRNARVTECRRVLKSRPIVYTLWDAGGFAPDNTPDDEDLAQCLREGFRIIPRPWPGKLRAQKGAVVITNDRGVFPIVDTSNSDHLLEQRVKQRNGEGSSNLEELTFRFGDLKVFSLSIVGKALLVEGNERLQREKFYGPPKPNGGVILP